VAINLTTEPHRRYDAAGNPAAHPRRVRSIVWLTGTLNQIGGGERLILEGAKYFAAQGVQTRIVTWSFHPRALFDGAYSADNITVIQEPRPSGNGVLPRTIRRAATLLDLRRLLRQHHPDIVMCQSEYDCIVAWLATRGLGIPYAVEIFGQMFQFNLDFAKYTLAFRRHLRAIRDSKIGYQQTVPLQGPRLNPVARVVQEILAFGRRMAVRRAACIGTTSHQVQWEVGLLYDCPTIVLKGAYGDDIFKHQPRRDLRRELGLDGRQVILSVCRLVPKKRVHELVTAFARLGATHANAVLLVGGGGPDADALAELAVRLGVSDRVRFLGYVPERDLYDYMGAADLVVSLDIADFDIAGYEPLALGTPALWSSEHEVDDALKDHPWLFTTNPDPDAIAAAMARALAAPRPARSEALVAPLRAYTWSARFAKLHAALEDAVAASPS
jgi:glycosyltransferase involved in cell wall biosynthesis